VSVLEPYCVSSNAVLQGQIGELAEVTNALGLRVFVLFAAHPLPLLALDLRAHVGMAINASRNNFNIISS